jgi:exo-beta-1,3-glucanase (GH17 family)
MLAEWIFPMRLGLACLAVAATVIGAAWAWLGAPVGMPQGLNPGEKLWCISYAPFRGLETPFNVDTALPAARIEEDLIQLAKLTDCVRIYSADQGLEHVLPIAQKLGLKVLQGFWVSPDPVKTKVQMDLAIDLVNRYPDAVRALVVGNEVLLRGDMSAPDLANLIRQSKARVKVPVTYADVWEFWLRSRDVAAAVDFLTIHILPYWEDFPIATREAGPHVASIHHQMAQAFAGKEVIIGEVGWPSAGRMREGALPSPADQARVVQDVLALAKRDKIHVNVIEAYDQPWKRALEGTVGGHWGFFNDADRAQKFEWGTPVSNHPHWKIQAAGGIFFAVLIFGAAWIFRRSDNIALTVWLGVTGNAIAGGLIGWTFVNVPLESLYLAGWSRSLAYAAVAIAAPVAVSIAMTRGTPLPRFSHVLGPAGGRTHDPLGFAIGMIMIATMLLALVCALGLVFDPRYRDFPFAPLTAAAVPLLLHALLMPQPAGERGAAELGGAVVLALTVPYIVFNETLANWQALWVCAALAAIAFSLTQVRAARG